MKHYTTIEQSKKLLELGLSSDTADMCYKTVDIDTEDDVNEDYVFDLVTRSYSEYLKYVIPLGLDYKAIPCWSLGALLEVMPHCITGWDGIEYTRIIIGNVLEYSNRESGYTQSIISIPSNNLLSPAYNMVVWLLENGYIERKKYD